MEKLKFAKLLRKKSTYFEKLIWKELRNKRLGGYKFRRQVPIGPYVADFVCKTKKLVVELDGPLHELNREYDLERDHWLESRGYFVLRISNDDLWKNGNKVCESILRYCQKL